MIRKQNHISHSATAAEDFMEKPEFIYKAFISYTARDSQFADQLETWLYRLAAYLDPEQAYAFFRDTDYSEAGENVEEKLKQHLEESEWLIPVCSPYVNEYSDSERNWVDFECKYFAYTLGKKDRIVCIISDSAPSSRDIGMFYPESIRDLQKQLATDMRAGREWMQEAARLYSRISGRTLDDVHSAAHTLYWKTRYYDTIAAAYKNYKKGRIQEALRAMAEIPDMYNPCKIEWNFLKALCSKSAYHHFCGHLNQSADSRVICFDRKSSYAYSADHQRLHAINALSAKVVSAVKAHDGRPFRFFYIAENQFGTFDDQITVKLWQCGRETIRLIKQASVAIPFSASEPAVYKSFYPDCQLNNIPAAYHHGAHWLALAAHSHLFLVDTETMEYKTINIPPLKPLAAFSLIWKQLVFSEKADMLFLSGEQALLGWDLNTGLPLKDARAVCPGQAPDANRNINPNFAEPCCPAVLWQGALWGLAFRRVKRPFYDGNGNELSGKRVTCDGITAIITGEKTGIAVFNEEGQCLVKREICLKKRPTMLSDSEMNLPPGNTASQLLKAYISKCRDDEMYECSACAFADKRNLLIGCTKGRLFLWDTANNTLAGMERIHKQDITAIHVYRKWDTILTADCGGTIAIWQYREEHSGISIRFISSLDTQKTNPMAQMVPGNRAAVFCNDTGELTVYNNCPDGHTAVQTRLSAEAAEKNHIRHVLSMYVTADQSRLVVCRPNQIDFIRLPEGNAVLEYEMYDEIKEMAVYDDETKMRLTMKDRSGYEYEETYEIAGLTDTQYEKLLADRRARFFYPVTL